MIDLRTVRRVYFLGIGGIGMSALARYFLHTGSEVFGYDRDKNTLTKKLVAEGMKIHFVEKIENIPKDIDLGIYTPAIPNSSIEYRYLQKQNIPFMKRAEVLGLLSHEKKTLAIAGTHGKTTTSAFLSHILTECKTDASAIIGGIMTNYNSNFIFGKAPILVTEADEYDRSFLHLKSDMAAINSLDADHLDIYGNHIEMLDSFQQFALNIKKTGILFIPQKAFDQFSESTKTILEQRKVKVVFFGNEDDLIVSDLKYVDDMCHYKIWYNNVEVNLESILPGWHNAYNSAVGVAMAMELGCDVGFIRSAMKSFKGIKRRFETIYADDQLIIIDDYAHHPTELTAAVSTARKKYPDKKITGIFQPHLFSRTADFYVEFGRALTALDELLLTEIYPAREKARPGVTSRLILDEVKMENKKMILKQEILDNLDKKDIEVLLILGAGDIDKEILKIKNYLVA